MAFFNGQGGSLSVNGTTLCVETYTITTKSDNQDVTTTCSNSWQDLLATIKSGELSFSTFYDSTFTYTPLLPGATITVVCPLGASGRSFTFHGIVGELAFENPAKGVVKVSGSAGSTGAITFP